MFWLWSRRDCLPPILAPTPPSTIPTLLTKTFGLHSLYYESTNIILLSCLAWAEISFDQNVPNSNLAPLLCLVEILTFVKSREILKLKAVDYFSQFLLLQWMCIHVFNDMMMTQMTTVMMVTDDIDDTDDNGDDDWIAMQASRSRHMCSAPVTDLHTHWLFHAHCHHDDVFTMMMLWW